MFPQPASGLDTWGRCTDTGPVTASAARNEAVCCGAGGSWAPPAGEPLVIGCMLCPQSTTYWRTNRADGTPYRAVPPLGTGGV